MIKIGNLLLAGVIFLSVPLILGSKAYSQSKEVEVQATVDRNKMGSGDTLTLKVTVSSSKSVSVSEPRLPTLKGFDLMNSWNGSESRSSFTNDGFKVERKQVFNYVLAPSATGKLKIGAAKVIVDGKEYKTEPIDITVIKGQLPSARQAQRPPTDPFQDEMDLFSRFLQRRPPSGFDAQPINPKEAFFIRLELDKQKAYVGEQITASWYLYTRGQIRDIDTLKYPSLKGFWKEDIEIATRLNFTNEVINGLAYKKALLASFALFPIKEGTSLIDPYKAKCTVIAPSSMGFGFGRPYVYTKASQQVKIQVLPLPTENKPSDFTGAVGNFSVSTRIDSASVPVNQPVTLKVRFEGQGNAKLIDLPSLNLPPSLEVYDTKKESKFFKNGQSYKEFEVLLIPREAGEIQIPATSVSLFNPQQKLYYSRQTEPIKLTVVPGEGPAQIPSSPLTENTSGEPKKKPRVPVLELSWQSSRTNPFFPAWVMWLVIYSALFGFLGWQSVKEFGFRRRKEDLLKLMETRIKKIQASIQSDQWRRVGVEATNLVYLVLGEVSGQGGANLELEKLLLKVPPSVRRELGDEIHKLMSQLQVISFAPEEVVGNLKSKQELKKLVSQTEKLLKKIVRRGDMGEESMKQPNSIVEPS